MLIMSGFMQFCIAGRNKDHGHWILEVRGSTVGQACEIPHDST